MSETHTCPNCNRNLDRKDMVRHHLTPRQKGGSKGETAMFCRPCENHLHGLYPNSVLKRDYNTVEKIIADPEMQKFGKWVSKTRHTTIKFSGKGKFHR